MVAIIFASNDGKTRVVQANVSLSVITAARNADVPTIDEECGAACSCATSQIHVNQPCFEKAGLPPATEGAMQEQAPQRRPDSRRFWWIAVTAPSGGLKLLVPETQY